jgi:transcription antitermination factor NusG
MYQSIHTEIPARTISASVDPSTAEEPALKRWFAVYTFPQHEKACLRQLELRGIDAFLPTCVQEKLWKNRQRAKVQLPLFPSYLFVRMSPRERSKVFGAPGVLRVLGNSQGPQPIPDAAIEFLCTNPYTERMEPQPEIVVGQKVRIRRGPMRGLEGVLLRKKNSLWFVISIELINQSAMVEVNPNDVDCRPA